jgi:hypothetical protein
VKFLHPLDKITLSKNLFPKIRLFGSWLYGPKDSLQNITIEEFAFADKAFTNYLQSKDEKWLNRLVACLYRTKNSNTLPQDHPDFVDDARKPFNSYSLTYTEKYVSKLPDEVKICVLLFFWGCRNQIANTYKNVFSGKNQRRATSLDLGWIQVMFEASGEKFGTIDLVAKNNVHLFLAFLDNEIIKSLTPKK